MDSCSSCGSELEEDDLLELICPLGCETQPPQQNNAEAAGSGGVGDKSYYTNGNGRVQRPSHFDWTYSLSHLLEERLTEAIRKHGAVGRATFNYDTIRVELESLRNQPNNFGTHDPEGLSETDIQEDLDTLARAYEQKYNPPQLEQAEPLVPARAITVELEDAEAAEHSNAEYLSRPALLDRLLYTHHASLHCGGKHGGKTTCNKTEAMTFASGGGEIWGRKAEAVPVIYAASDDEYPSVRMDFLRMGWTKDIPLKLLRIKDNADREFVLEDIAKEALKMGAYMVYLDMLFDFVQVLDEIKYAPTKEEMGKVVQLAIAISGHVKSTHHSQKWAPDAMKAAQSALGSQAIVARFSPILLSKCWVEPKLSEKGELIAPGLFTIESTMTRDPRGQALPSTVVERDERGWAVSKGEFKAAMKWPLYQQRIIDLFEMQEPGTRLTVATVAQSLEISRPEIQNAMYRMCEESGNPNPVLERQKRVMGHGYTYALLGVNTLPQRKDWE